MVNKQNTPKGGELYEKPKLRVIELVAEEVMGTSCKSAGGLGAGSFCEAFNIACSLQIGS